MRELSFLLLAAHTFYSSALPDPRNMPYLLGYSIYNDGPYPFLACTESQGQTLVKLFERTGKILSNQVIQGLSNGPQDHNQDAFGTFFSTNSKADVQDVFQNMVDRAVVGTLGTNQNTPSIICLNDDHTPAQLQGHKRVCESEDKPFAFTHAASPSQPKDICLCPRYFNDLKAYPEASVNCPTVVYRLSSTKFQLHSDAVNNQFGILIHELSHIYHPDQAWSADEIYDLNVIINADPQYEMTAGAQLNNANNYAYYAVCVYLGCKDYPRLSKMAGRNKQDTSAGFNTTDPIPDVLEDVSFASDSFDGDELQANLTALGF